MTRQSSASTAASAKARVLLVGGVDAHLRIPLVHQLTELGYDVGVMGSGPPEPFAAAEVSYWHYRLKRGLTPIADLAAMRQMHACLEKIRPNIVHAFDTKPGILVPRAAADAGVPVRMRTITGMGYVFSSRSPLVGVLRPVYRGLQKRTEAAADFTVFQNRDDQDYFLRHGMVSEGRQALIPGSGIDVKRLAEHASNERSTKRLRAELGLDGSLVVLMVARLVRNKGVREYLECARRVRRKRRDIVFLLVGPRAEEGWQAVPETEIRCHGADVMYLGSRQDVPELMGLADIFVLPTYYREGVPRVLLEAGALGIPLITTDMPGCRDVVEHGRTGLLVPPRDASALEAAVTGLIESGALRRRLGQAARERVTNEFSLERVARAYDEVYRNLLENAGVAL